jgi:hypothetical protein
VPGRSSAFVRNEAALPKHSRPKNTSGGVDLHEPHPPTVAEHDGIPVGDLVDAVNGRDGEGTRCVKREKRNQTPPQSDRPTAHLRSRRRDPGQPPVAEDAATRPPCRLA